MKDNILETFLSLMKIRHTKAYTRQHFTEHPHKYNLYGLSSMLFDYWVENSWLLLILLHRLIRFGVCGIKNIKQNNGVRCACFLCFCYGVFL